MFSGGTEQMSAGPWLCVPHTLICCCWRKLCLRLQTEIGTESNYICMHPFFLHCTWTQHLAIHFLSKYLLLFLVCFIFKEGDVVVCVCWVI